MTLKFRIGRKKSEIPGPSKFDRLNQDDLYVCIEQAIWNTEEVLRGYRTDPENRGAYPAMVVTHLETALAATQSLIRREALRHLDP